MGHVPDWFRVREQQTNERILPFCGKCANRLVTQGSIGLHTWQEHKEMGSVLIFHGFICSQSTNLHKLCKTSHKVYHRESWTTIWKGWRNQKGSWGPVLSLSPRLHSLPRHLLTSKNGDRERKIGKQRWKNKKSENTSIEDKVESIRPCLNLASWDRYLPLIRQEPNNFSSEWVEKENITKESRLW